MSTTIPPLPFSAGASLSVFSSSLQSFASFKSSVTTSLLVAPAKSVAKVGCTPPAIDSSLPYRTKALTASVTTAPTVGRSSCIDAALPSGPYHALFITKEVKLEVRKAACDRLWGLACLACLGGTAIASDVGELGVAFGVLLAIVSVLSITSIVGPNFAIRFPAVATSLNVFSNMLDCSMVWKRTAMQSHPSCSALVLNTNARSFPGMGCNVISWSIWTTICPAYGWLEPRKCMAGEPTSVDTDTDILPCATHFSSSQTKNLAVPKETIPGCIFSISHSSFSICFMASCDALMVPPASKV